MRQRTGWACAAVAVLCLAQPTIAEAKHGDKTAAVIVGGLLLGAAALAASSSDHQHQNQYVPPPQPQRPAAPFSPATNVTCYPREGACYNNSGDFLPSWTSRVF
ncbi:hypothetical protein OSH11_17865 [Kaistia dalseonensis]|uniref:Uncharacterized protein n=1 Tax=Kaistia dalseonensis TaxID=410840 RepID=A0ABU0HCG4_9HYPH|nr:hypothetical protein [Kaistia dalseonensis]MCX5496576.1 hypothetical protein [Kaistia dalseonensis]MDQ0439199.1 hypothetical protein [Kaistia dalseonensis]